jgi:hypothetical protein
MVLSGHMYSPAIPDLPFERTRLRFSTDLLEIVWSPSGKADCRINFDGREKKDLLFTENFSTLIEWCETGPVEAQIWLDGKRTIRGPLPLGRPNIDLDWSIVAKIVRLLRLTAGTIEQSHIRLSLADLNSAARDLIAFQQLVEAPSLRIEFEPSFETPSEFGSLIYFIYVERGWARTFGYLWMTEATGLARPLYVNSFAGLSLRSANEAMPARADPERIADAHRTDGRLRFDRCRSQSGPATGRPGSAGRALAV